MTVQDEIARVGENSRAAGDWPTLLQLFVHTGGFTSKLLESAVAVTQGLPTRKFNALSTWLRLGIESLENFESEQLTWDSSAIKELHERRRAETAIELLKMIRFDRVFGGFAQFSFDDLRDMLVEAKKKYTMLLPILRETDPLQAATILTHVGAVTFHLSNDVKAGMKFLDDAVEIAEGYRGELRKVRAIVLAKTYFHCGDIERVIGKWERAQLFFEKSLAVLGEEIDPLDLQIINSTLGALDAIGRMQMHREMYESAGRTLSDAYRMATQHFSASQIQAMIAGNLGRLKIAANDPEEGCRLLREAVHFWEKLEQENRGAGIQKLVLLYHVLGEYLLSSSRVEEGRQAYENLIQHASEYESLPSWWDSLLPMVAEAKSQLAICASRMADDSKAVSISRESLQLYEEMEERAIAFPVEEYCDAMVIMCSSLDRKADLKELAAIILKASKLRKKCSDRNEDWGKKRAVRLCLFEADVLAESGKVKASIKLFEKAWRQFFAQQGLDNEENISEFSVIAQRFIERLAQLGEIGKAREVTNSITTLFEEKRSQMGNHGSLAGANFCVTRAELSALMGNTDEAFKDLERVGSEFLKLAGYRINHDRKEVVRNLQGSMEPVQIGGIDRGSFLKFSSQCFLRLAAVSLDSGRRGEAEDWIEIAEMVALCDDCEDIEGEDAKLFEIRVSRLFLLTLDDRYEEGIPLLKLIKRSGMFEGHTPVCHWRRFFILSLELNLRSGHASPEELIQLRDESLSEIGSLSFSDPNICAEFSIQMLSDIISYFLHSGVYSKALEALRMAKGINNCRAPVDHRQIIPTRCSIERMEVKIFFKTGRLDAVADLLPGLLKGYEELEEGGWGDFRWERALVLMQAGDYSVESAKTLERENNLEAAKTAYLDAKALLVAHSRETTRNHNWDLIAIGSSLGSVLFELHDLDQGDEHFEGAIQLLNAVPGSEVEHQIAHAEILKNQGLGNLRAGKYAVGSVCFRRSLDLLRMAAKQLPMGMEDLLAAIKEISIAVFFHDEGSVLRDLRYTCVELLRDALALYESLPTGAVLWVDAESIRQLVEVGYRLYAQILLNHEEGSGVGDPKWEAFRAVESSCDRRLRTRLSGEEDLRDSLPEAIWLNFIQKRAAYTQHFGATLTEFL